MENLRPVDPSELIKQINGTEQGDSSVQPVKPDTSIRRTRRALKAIRRENGRSPYLGQH